MSASPSPLSDSPPAAGAPSPAGPSNLAAPPSPASLATLAALATGRAAVVAAVRVPGALGDRLVELGLTPGAPIAILRRGLFGDPLQVQVRDYVLSLRASVAAAIAVVPGPAVRAVPMPGGSAAAEKGLRRHA